MVFVSHGVHFTGLFRGEVAGFQIHDDVAPQLEVVKEEIEVEILVTDFHVDLPSDQGKADAEFEQELFHMGEECVFDGPFVGIVTEV